MPELDTPPVIQAPAENSDDAVRARFNTSVRELPPEQRGNIVLKDEPQGEVKPPVAPKEPPKDSAKDKVDTDIPSEFFDPPKQEMDEWEKITNEEQKGHIKSEDWKNYKKLTASKVEALKKELEDTRTKLPKDDYVPERTAKELERLKKDLQERDELISRKYVQDSPEFKERFGKKETILNNQLEKLGKELGLEEDQVHAISQASTKRRYALLDELDSGSGKAAMSSILSERDRLQEEKSLYLDEKEKSNVSWQEQQSQQTDQQKAKEKELYDYAFNETLDRMSKEFPALKKIPGNDAWNKAIDADISAARSMYNGEGFTPQRDAEMFLVAAAGKRLGKMLETAIKRATTAEKEVADLKAAGPSASQAEAGKDGDPYKGMTSDERARATFNDEKAKAANNGFRR